MWDTVETMQSFAPDWKPPSSGSPRMGLAFRVATPSDVDTAYERIVSLGYGSYMEPWDAFWGMRYAVVLDPDGTHVDLFCPNDAPSSP